MWSIFSTVYIVNILAFWPTKCGPDLLMRFAPANNASSANKRPVSENPTNEKTVSGDPTNQRPVSKDPTNQRPVSEDHNNQRPESENPTNERVAEKLR